jgi:hypothetical protein
MTTTPLPTATPGSAASTRRNCPQAEKWFGFLQIMGASPNSANADTLDEGRAAIAKCYERLCGRVGWR